MNDTLTITLPRTIERGGNRYSEITLVEPTVGQVIQAQKAGDGVVMMTELIRLNAGVSRDVAEMLPMRAFRQASEFLSGFFETGGPETGEE